MWNPFQNPKRDSPVSPKAESFLLLTYNSCRYDAYLEAKTPVLDAHVEVRRAYSQATYTYASHASMFQGILPHVSGPEPFYNRFVHQMWRLRHGEGAQARVMFPSGAKSIIDGFNQMGYYTCAAAAMSWFRTNPYLRDGWQDYEWTGRDARRQVAWTGEQLNRRRDQPFFAFINFGETHSPYCFDVRGGDPEGTRAAREAYARNTGSQEAYFDEEKWRMQIACVEFLDARVGELLAALREAQRDVTVVMCGDHGECFGEDGLYGHGFYHPKVMEVPMAIFEFKAGS